tara:strand:- start:778 stop:906 length:129 start_codon:yes stop_codon:yes gene_type:complete
MAALGVLDAFTPFAALDAGVDGLASQAEQLGGFLDRDPDEVG